MSMVADVAEYEFDDQRAGQLRARRGAMTAWWTAGHRLCGAGGLAARGRRMPG